MGVGVEHGSLWIPRRSELPYTPDPRRAVPLAAILLAAANVKDQYLHETRCCVGKSGDKTEN